MRTQLDFVYIGIHFLPSLSTEMSDKPRYLSLDVFRGATVFLMIIVNNPGEWGAQYGPIQHAPWHGFTLTDLVFPSFLFAVGNAMAFVMKKFQQNGEVYFWKKVFKRTVLIFLIGVLLNWFPFYDFGSGSFYPFSELRIFGVLQRIALCYLFASIIIHYSNAIRPIVVISSVMLLAYWGVVYVFGSNEPYSLTGFIGNDLDLWLVGQNHVYHGEGQPFDPEGLLSTIPAVVNVLLGYLTGAYLVARGNSYDVITKLLVCGCLLILGGLFWDLFFPINKKIWTSSYVLLTSGMCVVAIAILSYWIELAGNRKGAYFFEVFGKNPLFIYAFSWVLSVVFSTIQIGSLSLHGHIYQSFKYFLDPVHASFLYALVFTLLNWLVGYYLDKRGIYIKV
ncbi:MAG: heparan-alpha-glucosaminide N-acetyltransferase domain-containing protein [Marinoscillum sp.]